MNKISHLLGFFIGLLVLSASCSMYSIPNTNKNHLKLSNQKMVTMDIPSFMEIITFAWGDITESSYEAMVNAANEQLQAGGGVCGAIFEAAGSYALQQACYAYPIIRGDIRCLVGNACITDSFNLATRGIRKIIHAVGPDCRKITDIKEQNYLLREVYINTLRIADENNIGSIAVPFISSAIYAFPKKRACAIALKTVKEYFKNNPKTNIKSVQFVLFSKEDFELFSKAWEALNQ